MPSILRVSTHKYFYSLNSSDLKSSDKRLVMALKLLFVVDAIAVLVFTALSNVAADCKRFMQQLQICLLTSLVAMYQSCWRSSQQEG